MLSASDLLAAANARFGQAILRQRVAPTGDAVTKDVQLLEIAQSVLGAVQGAAQVSVGWPLPGEWPAGSLATHGPTALTTVSATVFTVPETFVAGTLIVFDGITPKTDGVDYTIVGNAVTFGSAPTGPVTGTWAIDIAGTDYEDLWPADLFQKALELFDYRTYAGLEVVPTEKLKIGQAAEAWFRAVAKGAQALGLAVETDAGPPDPMAARDRQGRNLLNDGAANAERILDSFVGAAWDYQ